MEMLTLVRIIGLAVVVTIFVTVVLYMPRIMGVNPPSTAAPTPPVPPPAPVPTRASTMPVATIAAAGAAEELAKS